MELPNYDAVQARYFSDLKQYCSKPANHHYCLLSGDVDSFLLLAAAMQTHESVTILTIRGDDLTDYNKAKQAADYYGLPFKSLHVGPHDMMANLDLLKGSKDHTVFSAMFRISFMLLLQKYPIADGSVYQGDGGDTLYGNKSHFVYLTTKKVAAERGITSAAARELLRREQKLIQYTDEYLNTGLVKFIREYIEQHGCRPVQPLMDSQFAYVLDVPLPYFKGNKKAWVKDGLVKHFGVSREIAYSRMRCSMQDGMGYRKKFTELLRKHTGIANGNTAVAALSE